MAPPSFRMPDTPAPSLKRSAATLYFTPAKRPAFSSAGLSTKPILTPARALVARGLRIDFHPDVLEDEIEAGATAVRGSELIQMASWLTDLKKLSQRSVPALHRLTNSEDVARARDQLDRARDARDSLSVKADIAEQHLVGLVEEVKRAEADYDYLVEALDSAKHDVGKWRATLHKNGKTTIKRVSPPPSQSNIGSVDQLSASKDSFILSTPRHPLDSMCAYPASENGSEIASTGSETESDSFQDREPGEVEKQSAENAPCKQQRVKS